MNELKCEFCNKLFTTKTVLKNHQKRTKYCLELQKKLGISTINDDLKQCEYCLNFFASNMINRHLKTCKSRKEELLEKLLNDKDEKIEIQLSIINKQNIEIAELRAKIKIYENDHECILELAKQPKNTTNNKILNISCLDLSGDRIKNVIDSDFTKKYLCDGQKGLADFTVEKLLKDKDGQLAYVCTDPSRQIFKYRDKEGEFQRDIKAEKLTDVLKEGGIIKKSIDICPTLWTENTGEVNIEKFTVFSKKAAEVQTLKIDNTKFRTELATRTTV